MDIRLIDPRDATAEVDEPVYRVEVRSADESKIDTYRLSDVVDVSEVIEWSSRFDDTSVVLLYVEVHDSGLDALTLIRLLGPPSPHASGAGVPAVASG